MLRIKSMVIVSLFYASAAEAADAAPVSFQSEGIRYEYFIKFEGELVKIDGTVVNNGDKFTLFVEPNGRVTGRVAGQSVRFSVRKTVRDSAAAKLKKEQDLAVADLSAR